MIVKPVEGRLILVPGTRMPVPAEGMRVSEHNTFWQACIRDGDVALHEEPAPAAEPAAALAEAHPEPEPAPAAEQPKEA